MNILIFSICMLSLSERTLTDDRLNHLLNIAPLQVSTTTTQHNTRRHKTTTTTQDDNDARRQRHKATTIQDDDDTRRRRQRHKMTTTQDDDDNNTRGRRRHKTTTTITTQDDDDDDNDTPTTKALPYRTISSLLSFQSIILLEDADAAFASRDSLTADLHKAYEGLTHITFSGLLNSLDGVGSGEGRILFMTTNYPERLDPALIRPGRVDLKAYVGPCSDFQLVKLFQKFYQDLVTFEDCENFARIARQAAGETSLSPAMVQGFLLRFKNEPKKALENVIDLVEVGG